MIFHVPLPQGRFQPHGPQYLTGSWGVDKYLQGLCGLPSRPPSRDLCRDRSIDGRPRIKSGAAIVIATGRVPRQQTDL